MSVDFRHFYLVVVVVARPIGMQGEGNGGMSNSELAENLCG